LAPNGGSRTPWEKNLETNRRLAEDSEREYLAMTEQEVSRNEQQLVVFLVGNESYGIDIFRVIEIIRVCTITPIPKTQPHIRGLVNLRGKTIPVIDLRIRFKLSNCEDHDGARIIIVDTEDGHTGILVDGVREVLTLDSEQLDAAPTVASETDSTFVTGIAKVDAGLITLLDLDKALAA